MMSFFTFFLKRDLSGAAMDRTLMLLTVAVLLSASCASNTPRDQLKSLQKFDTDGIDAPVRIPELKNRPRSNFSAQDFLTLHSGLVVSGKYVKEEFSKKLDTHRSTSADTLELEFSIPIAKDGSVFGSCAPVTRDGYFLTAAHVIARENSYVLYAVSDSKKTFLKAAPCRVVYKNETSDFAIIKAKLPTTRYLRYRQTPLKKGEVLFAGGWMHEKGGGPFEESKPFSEGGDPRFKKVVASIPMIKGDSGSPLIDHQGRLCGVLSTMRVGVIIKMKPYSTAVMMRPSSIEGMIREDRRR